MTVQFGDKNESVRQLQIALNLIAGMWNRSDMQVGTEDGAFGNNTNAGVVNFQSAVGLASNGVVDDAVWNALAFTINVFTDGFAEINWSTSPTPTQRNDNYASVAVVTRHKEIIKSIAKSPYLPNVPGIGGVDWKLIGIIAAITLGLFFINMDKKR